jgi:hypothetical protein
VPSTERKKTAIVGQVVSRQDVGAVDLTASTRRAFPVPRSHEDGTGKHRADEPDQEAASQIGITWHAPRSRIRLYQSLAKGDSQVARRAGSKKVRRIMREFKTGTLKSSSGAKVRKRKQAIAIALREARQAGAKIPKKKAAAKTKKAAPKR